MRIIFKTTGWREKRRNRSTEIVRYGASKESETPYFLEGCVARTLVTAVPLPPDSVLPGRPSITGGASYTRTREIATSN
jgi:hypothetical protein